MSKRGLSVKFVEDLNEGKLSPILEMVKENDTYDLQIRDNYINVYYRGACLLKLAEKKKDTGEYTVYDFAEKYVKLGWGDTDFEPTFQELYPSRINTVNDALALVEMLPVIRNGIDCFLTKNPATEREMQQLVVRENNYSVIANCTDYLIADIEYTHTDCRNLKLDLVSVFWPSDGAARRKHADMKIGIIEMKYGDGSLGGKAGIKKHFDDLIDFYNKRIAPLQANTDTVNFTDEMQIVVRQKAELGLIKISKLDKDGSFRHKKIELNTPAKPEWILLLANHDPEKTELFKELNELSQLMEKNMEFPFDVKIATANFMGYGLYREAIYPLKQFLARFEMQDHSK